jgi:hypothetical protein
LLDARQQVQAFLAAGLQREVHVLQDQVDRRRGQQRERLARAVGADGVEAGLLEQQGQRDLDRAVVVDDQDAPLAM